MIVMKFGGTSVANARSVKAVARIVRSRLRRKPVVVVSALAGVTDDLVDLCDRAGGDESDVARLAERHLAVARELDLRRTPSKKTSER